ncbi:hypothetical protein ACEPPN_012149 [Leptodophora sp. 'Broadleaf-Isolate-01']
MKDISSCNGAAKTSPWKHACDLLSTIRPGQFLATGTPGYELVRSSFWSKTQADVKPRGIFQPSNAADVAVALLVLQFTRCPFAVKSGGHGRYPGESTVENGVLIDLVALNHIEVSPDRSTVSVGPGRRWFDVYSALEPLSLVVVGGRDADVGVGGFLLGGGIAFHSSMYGWATDNVKSFEAVLGNGSIVTASRTENTDLFRALRGGGGNFAIITSFVIDAYPYSGMWGGVRVSSWDYTKHILDAMIAYGLDSPNDPKVSVILNHGYHEGKWFWSNDLEYCDGVDDPPSQLKSFMDVPAIMDSTKRSNVSTLALAISRGSDSGFRNSYWVLVCKLDIRILEFYIDTFVREGEKLLGIPGFNPTGDIQVITAGMLKGMDKHGSNVLGLANSTEPLLLFNPAPRWHNAEDDETMLAAFQKIISSVRQEAEKLNVNHDFLYMNYSSQFQDVIAGYGSEQKEFMLQTSRKYDPEGVFQHLRAGGFKLHGAPLGGSSF